MAVLSRSRGLVGVALAGLAGCYSPDVRDCVVSCADPIDCAPGQVCGGDGFCASPEIAGACSQLGEPDARDPGRADARFDARTDARPDEPDATPPVDAVVMSTLRIDIAGEGRVHAQAPVDEQCESDAGGTMCTYPVPLGTTVVLKEHDGHGWTFDGWDYPGCTAAAPPSTCTVTIGSGLNRVGATFTDED